MGTAAVILNYNDSDTTIKAVRRIADFKCFDHVIVVDNASKDGSADRIEAFLKKLEQGEGQGLERRDIRNRYILLRSDTNGGYGHGNNLGVMYAYRGLGMRQCLIANPDSCFDEKLVLRLKSCMEDNGAAVVGAVMSLKEKPDYRDIKASAWPLRSAASELLNSGPLSRRLCRRSLNYERGYFDGRREVMVGAVHGSLMLVDCEAFARIGGFDENIFLYCEENVLAYKMKERGFKIFLNLEGSYSHEGGASISHAGLGATRRQRIRQRSERYYYRHYLGAGPLFMGFTYIFQMIVLMETFLYERVSCK